MIFVPIPKLKIHARLTLEHSLLRVLFSAFPHYLSECISIPALYFLVLFSACTSQKSHKSQKATSKTR